MEAHISDHFNILFNQHSILQDNSLIEGTIPTMVNDQLSSILTSMLSSQEIHQVFMGLNRDSAPDPYGF